MSASTFLHPKLTECKLCKCFDYTSKLHPLYHDCQVVQCKQCCSQWFVCQQHNKQFNVQNVAKLRNHFINDHLNTYEQDCENIDDDGEIGLCLTNVCESDNDDDISHNLYKKAKLDINSDTTNDQYRNPNQPYTSPRILSDIIGTAFSNESICPLNVSTSEIAFHLNITDFCCSLSESQQYQLTEIIHQLQSNHCIATRPPTSYQDLQKFYLSGKHAIYNNIPCPSVDQFDNHAYIKLNQIVEFALAHLDNLSIIQCSKYADIQCDNSSIMNTNAARSMLKNIMLQYSSDVIDPYVLFVTFWSDDFEVNHTRKNRNSTWIKTMTLIGSNETKTSKFHTQLVAIGKKGTNHNSVNVS